MEKHMAGGRGVMFEIRIKGHLDERREVWFEGMQIQTLENGETILRGMLPDQPALFGILSRIRDAGIPLLEIKRIKKTKRLRGKNDRFS